MRAPALMLLVIGLLGAPSAARAQDTFTDPDFGFKLTLPGGMHEATPAERAIIMGVSEEEARNVPRGELPEGGHLTHHYFWLDPSGPYHRQMDVHLYDGVPPYLKPEDLVEAYTKTGLAVDVKEQVKAPVGGLRLEGTFPNPKGAPMRKTVVYLPDRAKFAIVSMQSFAGDWQIVRPEFLQTVMSIRLERQAPTQGTAPAPGKGGKGKPGGDMAAGMHAPPGDETPIDWTSVSITGSLVLSVLLLAHLLLGGRGSR